MIDPAVAETVSVPLALQDAVPVVLSTAAYLVVARAVGSHLGRWHRIVGTIAVVLIGAGGACKVLWKLFASGALGEPRDYPTLENMLFPLLAAGFVGLYPVVRDARRGPNDDPVYTGEVAMLSAGPVLLLLLSLTTTDLVLRLTLVIAVLGSLAVSWQLWQVARQNADTVAAALIATNVAATFVLSGLARIEAQTLGLQWVEQSINTVSQGLLLAAALRLAREAIGWRDGWHAALRSQDAAGTPTAVSVDGQSLVAARLGDGGVALLDDRCAHQAVALSGGWIGEHGTTIVCPNHQWAFDRNGACVAIPANTSGVPIPDDLRVPSHPVAERFDVVWVRLGDVPGRTPRAPGRLRSRRAHRELTAAAAIASRRPTARPTPPDPVGGPAPSKENVL